MVNSKKGFDPFSFVIGILFIVVSFIVLRNPLPTFAAVITVAGIATILFGLYKLFIYRRLYKVAGVSSFFLIINGVLDFVFGVLMLFDFTFGSLFLTINFALFFITDSLFELWESRFIHASNSNYYWLIIVFAVLGLLIGIILLFRPAFAAISLVWMIAVYFMIYGIGSIIRSF
ncbi:DUF308 domain-containing protein [Oenococcus sp. UCMA 16435]|nr:DUF308 domain-containing protein [Oenococcus sp. UCMA 16435]MDI4584883.1 DUF308 domain-containing protein [Oenococcus sp. UCMA 14587]